MALFKPALKEGTNFMEYDLVYLKGDLRCVTQFRPRSHTLLEEPRVIRVVLTVRRSLPVFSN